MYGKKRFPNNQLFITSFCIPVSHKKFNKFNKFLQLTQKHKRSSLKNFSRKFSINLKCILSNQSCIRNELSKRRSIYFDQF